MERWSIIVKRKEVIEDEILMIKDGGEMPEVAFNASLYYLTKDQNGPLLSLSTTELQQLKEAVVQRFSIIVFRDLQPENRTKSIYRGLERSYANWFRLVDYCQRETFSLLQIRREVALELGRFLNTELHDVYVQGVTSCVNCTRIELEGYAESLDVDLDTIASGWQKLF